MQDLFFNGAPCTLRLPARAPNSIAPATLQQLTAQLAAAAPALSTGSLPFAGPAQQPESVAQTPAISPDSNPITLAVVNDTGTVLDGPLQLEYLPLEHQTLPVTAFTQFYIR